RVVCRGDLAPSGRPQVLPYQAGGVILVDRAAPRWPGTLRGLQMKGHRCVTRVPVKAEVEALACVAMGVLELGEPRKRWTARTVHLQVARTPPDRGAAGDRGRDRQGNDPGRVQRAADGLQPPLRMGTVDRHVADRVAVPSGGHPCPQPVPDRSGNTRL